ncbi:MAG: hypothetical protein KDA32_10285 [Phycisphaerales bacterium]|nr:hypothetical protein [Phycisphaerales bacterium]
MNRDLESQSGPGEITALLRAGRAGDRNAQDELFALVYPNLQRIARGRLAGRRHDIMQTTGLVNAACERLLGKSVLEADDRRHFYFLVARAIHDVLVEQLRADGALRRGGGLKRSPLMEIEVDGRKALVDALDLNDALEELATHDPVAEEVVRLRFYCGQTLEEVADHINCSLVTARRHWSYARAWLHERLSGARDADLEES